MVYSTFGYETGNSQQRDSSLQNSAGKINRTGRSRLVTCLVWRCRLRKRRACFRLTRAGYARARLLFQALARDLAEELEGDRGALVGLRQHGRARLDEDVEPRQLGGFLSDINVGDPTGSGFQIGLVHRQ